jgi:hypothetical protein
MKISLSRHAIAKNKETRREGLIRMSWYLTSITSPSPSIGTYAIIYERLSDRRECRNKVGLIRIRMRFIGLTRMRFVGLIRMSSGSSDEVVSIAIVWIHMYNMQIDMRAIIWWKPAQALVVVKKWNRWHTHSCNSDCNMSTAAAVQWVCCRQVLINGSSWDTACYIESFYTEERRNATDVQYIVPNAKCSKPPPIDA